MKRIAIILFLLAILMAGKLSADNRIMIMMDSIPNSLDTVDIPVGFENDSSVSFTNGFVLTASGDVSAKFEFAGRIANDRTTGVIMGFFIYGQDQDTLWAGCSASFPWHPLGAGPLEPIFFIRISIEGGYGEICIDSTSEAGPYGDWLWITYPDANPIEPSFNDGNGPHCVPYYYLCGDPSRDMKVNVSDAVRIVSYVFYGTFTPDPVIAADTNCDGTVNISDAVTIINYVFIGGHPPCDTNNDGTPDC
jgi:hypothetical protein